MSRRKTKKERELIADIKDTFRIYCESQPGCSQCKYREVEDWCIYEYMKDLIANPQEEKEHE